MEFSEDPGSATYRIKSYGQDYIIVNEEKYSSPILIMPEKLIAPWTVESYSQLTKKDFEEILLLKPQVLLIGTGFQKPGQSISVSKFLPPELIRPLTHQGIGVEVMSSASACRTYTILMSEGRNVAAVIFI